MGSVHGAEGPGISLLGKKVNSLWCRCSVRDVGAEHFSNDLLFGGFVRFRFHPVDELLLDPGKITVVLFALLANALCRIPVHDNLAAWLYQSSVRAKTV